jgi:hypothetical protein
MTAVFMYPGCDKATAYFAPWFISDPQGPILAGWEIDLEASTTCNPQCFEGVLVKDTYSQKVWRLTGKIDSRGFFEGRWPD